jgi:hypothetical protein
MDVAVAGEPNNPTFLLFSGSDFSHSSAFFNGGLLWSPAGLDADGFTLKTLLSGGGYTYRSDGLHTDIDGTLLSAAVMPGWRLARDRLNINVFGGPVVQDYRLTPYDPGSRLHGFYLGAQFGADIWYEPTAATMVAVNAAIATIGPTGSVRTAFGFRLFAPVFIGPETQQIWCADYQEVRFGGHITGWRVDAFEFSVGGGWAMTSDRRDGPYGRISIGMRY